MTNTLSGDVDGSLPRNNKSSLKPLLSSSPTPKTRKESSPDATFNSDQNIDEIAPLNSGEENLEQNDPDNVVQATPAWLSELQWEQPSQSPIVSQSDPVDVYPSSQDGEVMAKNPHKGYFCRPSYDNLPEVTISASIETGQPESSIKVPMQRKYTGRMPAIPSSVADIPCATLGVQGVLERLNDILKTSHSLDTASVLSVLEDCIAKNYDFGTAYGHLRGVWVRRNEGTIRDELHTFEEKDREERQKALLGGFQAWVLPPRRMWDLCSNRVVPYWTLDRCEWPMPISHAWVEEEDREGVWTCINGKEWPVPIPKDASLDLIRIEMLNLGVQYTWLDVLCLRQKGSPREDLRVDEWKRDVPTIGGVYSAKGVVIYLSGLGRPLSLKDGDLESDRCWFRRAWTLQEVGWERIIAGDTPDGPMHAKPDNSGNYETEILTRFHKKLEHMWEARYAYPLFSGLADMRERVSTNPVDRVAGLAFCLHAFHAFHAYDGSETEEEAWTALVNAMGLDMRGRILFLYPVAGLGDKKWRPTWAQVMSEPLPAEAICSGGVEHDNELDVDWHEGCRIEEGIVRGLSMGSVDGVDRCGELVVKDAVGMHHTFSIRATHQFPIPEGAFTLLSSVMYYPTDTFWVVGRILPDQRFEKLSVIMMLDREEEERLAQCGVVKLDCKTYLI